MKHSPWKGSNIRPQVCAPLINIQITQQNKKSNKKTHLTLLSIKQERSIRRLRKIRRRIRDRRRQRVPSSTPPDIASEHAVEEERREVLGGAGDGEDFARGGLDEDEGEELERERGEAVFRDAWLCRGRGS